MAALLPHLHMSAPTCAQADLRLCPESSTSRSQVIADATERLRLAHPTICGHRLPFEQCVVCLPLWRTGFYASADPEAWRFANAQRHQSHANGFRGIFRQRSAAWPTHPTTPT